ncbi:hypothetical protein [Lapillicoccus sp.]|uniref:hypothetical protein n=1 Tax=Lapillicoccus sp. TaxID=1909287 RepID=UPI003266085D
MHLFSYSKEALIGVSGSDAGSWWFNPATGKVEWRPGWEVERFNDLQAAVSALDLVARIKSPEVVDSIGSELGRFVHSEMSTYLNEAMPGEARTQ